MFGGSVVEWSELLIKLLEVVDFKRNFSIGGWSTLLFFPNFNVIIFFRNNGGNIIVLRISLEGHFFSGNLRKNNLFLFRKNNLLDKGAPLVVKKSKMRRFFVPFCKF